MRLIFENEEVRRYSFTASFETENIEQVMKALQASYYFTFKIDGRDIKLGRQDQKPALTIIPKSEENSKKKEMDCAHSLLLKIITNRLIK